MNVIYNRLGWRYLGYGYYLCTSISNEHGRGRAECSTISLHKPGTTLDRVRENSYYITERGVRKEVLKRVYYLKNSQDFFPHVKRYEAIEIVKENKELLELGLITQEKYDKEFKSIQYHLKNF